MNSADNHCKEYLTHFPAGIGSAIKQYVINEVFKEHRYIFTRRVGRQQYGYCTHCRKEFETAHLRHGKREYCPHCKSYCTIKASGVGRSQLINRAYFVYYEKSLMNSNVIIARGIRASRDYSGDYVNVATQFTIEAYYVFEVGRSTMIKSSYFYNGWEWKRGCKICSSTYSLFSQVSNNGFGQRNSVITTYSRESIQEAVKGTPFQYSTWDAYDVEDMVRFFSQFCKYPFIEYLTKLGFEELVKSRLYGQYTFGAVNWRGKNPLRILKISKNELKEIKKANLLVDPFCLRVIQIVRQFGSKMPVADIDKLADFIGSVPSALESLEQILKYVAASKVLTFMKTQYQQDRGAYNYSSRGVLTHWKDYIADCLALGMNLTDSRILFPKNLFTAHQETTKRIKTNENKFMDAMIEKRLPLLNTYCFEYQGLLIRPAQSTGEMIAEGKALNICVGNYQNGYMTKYSRGETNILLIRKKSDPNAPYYTMELRQKQIIQVQGKMHCSPTEEVKTFIEAFKNEKLKQKKKLTVPA